MKRILTMILLCLSFAIGQEPYMAEVRMFSQNFCPKGWAETNGQLLAINQNQALFSLLGTTYGGDGRVNFALPDLRGRGPMGEGNGVAQGERGGATNQTLTVGQLPQHDHAEVKIVQYGLRISPSAPRETVPDSLGIAENGSLGFVSIAEGTPRPCSGTTSSTLNNNLTTQASGGSQPFSTQQPSLAVLYCIALQGVFPSQN